MGNRLSLPFRRDSAEDMADILLNYESLLISLSYFFDMDVVKMDTLTVLSHLNNRLTLNATRVTLLLCTRITPESREPDRDHSRSFPDHFKFPSSSGQDFCRFLSDPSSSLPEPLATN